MPGVATKRVRFKDGKFKGQVMTINAASFDQRLHEEATAQAPGVKVETKTEAKAEEGGSRKKGS